MNAERRTSYAGAGVDIEAGERAVDLIKPLAAKTFRDGVAGTLGGFSAAFAPDLSRYEHPILLSATDGVGTKLAIAQTLGIHDTVGIDLVAMVVDDLVCEGGEPLFLLDYIACGRLVPERIEQIVRGVAEGCAQAGCALIGGETAEHPGVMDADSYDLAAFAVGIAEQSDMLGPEKVRDGDALIGLTSSGLHSNGYSLVRRLILEHDLSLEADPAGFGHSLGEELLIPTRIYAPAVLAAMRAGGVHAAAHITGGGIPGNVERILPGLSAQIERSSWIAPPIFSYLATLGSIDDTEMMRAFNMGLGMILAVAPASEDGVVNALRSSGETAIRVGSVTGDGTGVHLR